LNAGLYDKFLFAFSAEDVGIFGQQVKNAMKYRFEQSATKGSLEFPLQDWNVGRAHQYLALPKDIIPYLADCNLLGPNHEHCGECMKCKCKEEDYARLEQGLTPDECLKLRVERKSKNMRFVDEKGLVRSWVDFDIGKSGPVVPFEDTHHQEYKHIFTNTYDGGIHEPNE
jgi:hypothetical protein